MFKHIVFIVLVSMSAHSCLQGVHATETIVKVPMSEVLKDNDMSLKDLKEMCADIDSATDDVKESEAIQRVEEMFDDSEAVCDGLK